MNVEKVWLAFCDPAEVAEFFALEAKYLPVAGYMVDDFRHGELVQHERGWNIRLFLSPALASYAKKKARDVESTHQHVLPLTVGMVPLFAERGQGQKRRREPRSATPTPSPKISRPSPRSSAPKTPMKRASTAERLMELASGSGSESSRSSVKDRSGYRSGHNEDALSKLLPGAALGKAQGWEDRGIATSTR